MSVTKSYTHTKKEVFEKKNVEFLENGYVVRYSPVTTLFFEPSLSAGTESDTITFLNIPALVSD